MTLNKLLSTRTKKTTELSSDGETHSKLKKIFQWVKNFFRNESDKKQQALNTIREVNNQQNILTQDKKTAIDPQARLYKLKSLPANYAELSFSHKIDALDTILLSTLRRIENVRREMIRLTPQLGNITQADTNKFNQLKSKITRAESQIRATQGGKATTANLEAHLDQLKGLLPKNYANLLLRDKVNVLNALSLSTVKQTQLVKQITWKLYIQVKNSGDTQLKTEYSKLQPKLIKQLFTLAKDPEQAKQMNFKLIQLITNNNFATKEIYNISRKALGSSQKDTTSTTANGITNPTTNRTINN